MNQQNRASKFILEDRLFMVLPHVEKDDKYAGHSHDALQLRVFDSFYYTYIPESL